MSQPQVIRSEAGLFPSVKDLPQAIGQRRDVFVGYPVDGGIINSTIVVYDPMPQTLDLEPVDGRMSLLQFVADLVRSFSNDLKPVNHGIPLFIIYQEAFHTDIRHAALDAFRSL